MQLIIGEKNYSSWSLRAWFMIAKAGLDFQEILLPLDTEQFYREIVKYNPAEKVPTLIDNDITVWDSLAICEYVNETYLNGNAWPSTPKLRAKARAIASEMHSGFNAVRNELPMNIRATRHVDLSDDAIKDIIRIDKIWSQQMDNYAEKGGWLFGDWSITDVMFIPVIMRFKTYQVQLSEKSQAYMAFVLKDPELNRWIADALKETTIVAMDEAGVDV